VCVCVCVCLCAFVFVCVSGKRVKMDYIAYTCSWMLCVGVLILDFRGGEGARVKVNQGLLP